MMGKIIAVFIVIVSIAAGAGLYYSQVYGYYDTVTPTPGQDVMLIANATGQPEPIAYDNFQAIDAQSSPIRFRACFTTPIDPAALTGSYWPATTAEPLNPPNWFDCFDADEIGAGVQSGEFATFIGAKNIAYGVDRIVAIAPDGRGWIWHQLNDCGEKAYDGTVVGEECPPKPGSDS
ncbi:DUF6446 family protein [Seohaeicola saemankumensis]|nr:DUF6446 family protein [Seohaeicola saemankumensis]MCA0869750.1 DUF6446 family protein [Seohaeicola saemankumensis]